MKISWSGRLPASSVAGGSKSSGWGAVSGWLDKFRSEIQGPPCGPHKALEPIFVTSAASLDLLHAIPTQVLLRHEGPLSCEFTEDAVLPCQICTFHPLPAFVKEPAPPWSFVTRGLCQVYRRPHASSGEKGEPKASRGPGRLAQPPRRAQWSGCQFLALLSPSASSNTSLCETLVVLKVLDLTLSCPFPRPPQCAARAPFCIVSIRPGRLSCLKPRACVFLRVAGLQTGALFLSMLL